MAEYLVYKPFSIRGQHFPRGSHVTTEQLQTLPRPESLIRTGWIRPVDGAPDQIPSAPAEATSPAPAKKTAKKATKKATPAKKAVAEPEPEDAEDDDA